MRIHNPMSLTYQPFDSVPEIKSLGAQLHHNVPDLERLISAGAGAYLLMKSLGRNPLLKWSLMAAGTALIRRAWTGHCPIYEDMEVARGQRLAREGHSS